ncbi:MAG: tetratricopeptide repeat protein, partial [Nitrospinae bacterium]|nr:tetratricopeptide repeat protein [Nitrospinota bacterium]
ALKVDEGNFSARYRLGMAYDNLKEHQKAVEAFQKALEAKPDAANVWQSMGFAYEQLGSHDDAVRCFKKSLELEEIKRKG